VLDYVVAHEVAHLVEFNHSPRFWRIVAELCATPRESRLWLRENGFVLHAYGMERRSLQAL
jgi:predicted metal-dependent hydrolase